MKKHTNKIFDRLKLIKNKEKSINFGPNRLKPLYDFSVESICENISAIKRNYQDIAYLGPSVNSFIEHIPHNVQLKKIFICDISSQLLQESIQEIENNNKLKKNFPDVEIYPIIIEEELFPFKSESLDLVVSNLNLHYVNDLAVAFSRILDCLKPDGTHVGAILGEETLQELRIAFTLAESERCGGVSQHVSPFVSITEVGNLITRLKYNLPTVFSEKRILYFDTCLDLMQYLQRNGDNSCLLDQRNGIYKDTLYATIAIYESLFREKDKNLQEYQNQIFSTFEIINFAGWKYHESQPKPKKRGSAEFNLKDLSKQIQDIDPESAKIMKSGEIGEDDDENK
ncbi:hypothetical protein IMG5_199200 [Ichthyophthirius multifiliis]|uniref:Methyltransferase type 11 domain-containing protein n=1 Tax=Ichthyophthirius multifiliis TaxID=5932 RepID=G0R5I1_ICHMU|nr:hypothetical protein IMG5_199200 [Ichthyophthirius multifiliis]EGR27241.1 hypothetical protein IMG5_199200 [Ichthyophthirius multifiliis]|eukprot:XP_004024125.1 hypothetical protein IMG5_199200 [Ichthyophthirius multifiliis]